ESVPQGNTRLNDEYPTRDRKCEGERLRVVLLGERADRVDVDEDPNACRERLEEVQPARAGDELGELRRGDRGAVGVGLGQDGATRAGREDVREQPVAFVEDEVVVRDRRTAAGGAVVSLLLGLGA